MSIDVDALKARVDIVEVVASRVALVRRGREYVGRCPFHDERSPSFTVVPSKGYVHCFGCGAHYDVIGFLQAIDGVDFAEACKRLGATDDWTPVAPAEDLPRPSVGAWMPIMPVPADAPDLLQASGWTVPVWNPKREDPKTGELGKFSRFKPSRVDAYRDAAGRLLGYVLRCDFEDGKKITPQVTWCVGPDGETRWCLEFFPSPRPLQGLDALAARPAAPVLVVEGEKCRAAGADALTPYVVLTWPGGSKGIGHVDWSPLEGRDVVLWPDADQAGRDAMLGWTTRDGQMMPGVAQHLFWAGAKAIRFVDVQGQPRGWDIADAIRDGWTPKQLATWAAAHVCAVEVHAA